MVYENRNALKGESRNEIKTKERLPSDRENRRAKILTLLTHQSETELNFIYLEDSDSITDD